MPSRRLLCAMFCVLPSITLVEVVARPFPKRRPAYALSDESGNFHGIMSNPAGFTILVECISNYGSLIDARYVPQQVENLLDRKPATAASDSLVKALTPVSQGELNESREYVLVGIADSAETIGNATQASSGTAAALPPGRS